MACQQTKVWFPFLRGDFTSSHIRNLNYNHPGHLFHFTDGHHHLLRHRQKLDGEMAELCRLGYVVLCYIDYWDIPSSELQRC